MNKPEEDAILAFATELEETARVLRASVVEVRGSKVLRQRLRLRLTEIKKKITNIKRLTMEK